MNYLTCHPPKTARRPLLRLRKSPGQTSHESGDEDVRSLNGFQYERPFLGVPHLRALRSLGLVGPEVSGLHRGKRLDLLLPVVLQDLGRGLQRLAVRDVPSPTVLGRCNEGYDVAHGEQERRGR